MAARKKSDSIVTVTTKSGFTCSIDKDKLDDWEFARAAANAKENSADGLRLTLYMVEHMLSQEDARRLEDHVRTEDGRVPTSRMMAEVENIFTEVSAAKK